MNFSISQTKELLPSELRTAFNDLVKKEIMAREPSEVVKALFSEEPEQLNFNFTFPKK